MGWSPWITPTRTFHHVPQPALFVHRARLQAPWITASPNPDDVVTHDEAALLATDTVAYDQFQSHLDSGDLPAWASVAITGGIDPSARAYFDSGALPDDFAPRYVVSPGDGVNEFAGAGDNGFITAVVDRPILYYSVQDPVLATDQPLPEMDGLVVGVDYAANPDTGDYVQYQTAAPLIGWYFNVNEVPNWPVTLGDDRDADWRGRPITMNIWRLTAAQATAYQQSQDPSSGAFVAPRWQLPTGAPWKTITYTPDERDTLVPITPAPVQPLPEFGTGRNFALLFSLVPPDPWTYGPPVISGAERHGYNRVVGSGYWANGIGWAGPPLLGLIPTFRIPAFRYWQPTPAQAHAAAYLRMHQRNDGLGPNRHPRLHTSRSTASSVQAGQAPRVGRNNRYR